MNTKDIPQPFRARVKRARRKIANATAAAARAGGPPFGASITGLRELRKATLAHHRLTDFIARVAAAPTRDMPEDWERRIFDRARAEGVIR